MWKREEAVNELRISPRETDEGQKEVFVDMGIDGDGLGGDEVKD